MYIMHQLYAEIVTHSFITCALYANPIDYVIIQHDIIL
jgi:hypothetical protein